MNSDHDDDHVPDIEEFRRQVAGIETATDKYVYFLLATAAACIAYGMQRTSTSPFAPIDGLLLAAFGFWAFSFWAGNQNRKADIECASMHFFDEGIKLAYKADAIKNPSNPHLATAKAITNQFRKEIDELATKAAQTKQKSFRRQFDWLVYGAILFSAWHVIGMCIRNVDGASTPAAVKPKPATTQSSAASPTAIASSSTTPTATTITPVATTTTPTASSTMQPVATPAATSTPPRTTPATSKTTP